MYIVSPAVLPLGKKPQPLSKLLPELASKMIRQYEGHDALRIFGPYHWGAELVRRYGIERGRRYRRDTAIKDAAARVGLHPETLKNWLNRSKQPPKR
jgi:hypothetical protein